MTSAQLMLPKFIRLGFFVRSTHLLLLMMCVVCFLSACRRHRLHDPIMLQTPYAETKLWAVTPFANESGVSVVNTTHIADTLMEQAQQVDGLNVLPVNRVLFAMRQLNLPAVRSQAEALMLMNALNVDGLIVGTITAYDPYPPLTFGAAVELYTHDRHAFERIDLRKLTRSTSGDVSPGTMGSTSPTAQAAGVFDAANHRTLSQLKQFTRGRDGADRTEGPDRHLISMELYTKFVSYRLLHDLLEAERFRLQPIVEDAPWRAAVETER